MKKFFKWSLAAVCLSLFLCACDDDDEGVKTAVKLNETTLNLQIGATKTLQLEVTPPLSGRMCRLSGRLTTRASQPSRTAP